MIKSELKYTSFALYIFYQIFPGDELKYAIH